MALIHKVEALSDWLQEPKRKKYSNWLLAAMFAIAVLWGMLFVPPTILQDSAAARVWVDIATTLFPWIGQLEVHWGVAGQKALYLHSVFYLMIGIPAIFTNLGYWPHRIRNKKLMDGLPGEAIVWLMSILFVIGIWVLFYYLGHFGSRSTTRFILYSGLFISPYLMAITAFSCALAFWVFAMNLFLALLYLVHSIAVKTKHFRGY